MLKTAILPDSLTWLPDYHLRISARARYAQLRIHPEYGLEIILPKGVSQRVICALLHEQATWINKNRKRILTAHQHSQCPITLPTGMVLPALDADYTIEYQQQIGQSKRAKVALHYNTLLIQANLTSTEQCILALKNWLHYQAKLHLTPWLARLSQRCNLPYRRVQIRSQQRRWGSCSSQGDISLNDKLLFLAPTLVDHVLIHELCHTQHFNHSNAFWALVKRFDPDYHAHRQHLLSADDSLPRWLCMKCYSR